MKSQTCSDQSQLVFHYKDFKNKTETPINSPELKYGDLIAMFKSAYYRASREYRVNMLIYTTSKEIMNELETRGYDTSEAEQYAEDIAAQVNERLEEEITAMYKVPDVDNT